MPACTEGLLAEEFHPRRAGISTVWRTTDSVSRAAEGVSALRPGNIGPSGIVISSGSPAQEFSVTFPLDDHRDSSPPLEHDTRIVNGAMLAVAAFAIVVGGLAWCALSNHRSGAASVNAPTIERSVPDSTTGYGGSASVSFARRSCPMDPLAFYGVIGAFLIYAALAVWIVRRDWS